MTIEATRIINPGDEIKLFSEKPYYFGYSSEDDYPSDLEKKSTGDKRKQRDKLDDNLRDDNDRSDLEKKSTEDKRKQRDELVNVFILDNER